MYLEKIEDFKTNLKRTTEEGNKEKKNVKNLKKEIDELNNHFADEEKKYNEQIAIMKNESEKQREDAQGK
jgi:peptidoglycan hydrolase CwlO-like protein